MPKIPADWPPEWQQIVDRAERQTTLAEQLHRQYRNLSEITAYIMAGDQLSAEIAEQQMAERGLSAMQASVFIGSFYRLTWMAQQWQAGTVPDSWLLDGFPEEWSSTDHFGANPLFLQLWVRAFERNRRKTILVGRKGLPHLIVLPIYRGQDADVPLGYSWTLDIEVAKKFGAGMGNRTHDRERGCVFAASVAKRHVLGYVQTRREEEILVDPNYVHVNSVM